MKTNKENYKKYIKDTLINIDENLDALVESMFKVKTAEAHIIINIEPGCLVNWSFETKMYTDPMQIVHKEEK